LAFSPDSKKLISLGSDDVVKIWDWADREGPIAVQTFKKTVGALAFSHDGKALSGLGMDGTLKTINLTSGKELSKITNRRPDEGKWHPPDAMSFAHCAFSPDGKALALAEFPGDSVLIHESTTGKETRTFTVENSIIDAISFSSDGKIVGAGYRPNVQTIKEAQAGKVQWKWWNISTQAEVPFLQGTLEGVQCIAFSRDAQHAAIAKGDIVTIRELASGKDILTIQCYSHAPAVMTFSPDGKRLATGGMVQVQGAAGVKLWDLTTGQEILTLGNSTDTITALAFSPNGMQLAAASGVEFQNPQMPIPSAVRIWDATPVNDQSK
jgi:WD40 repeat protein